MLHSQPHDLFNSWLRLLQGLLAQWTSRALLTFIRLWANPCLIKNEEFNHNIQYTKKLYTKNIKVLKAPKLSIFFYFNTIMMVFSQHCYLSLEFFKMNFDYILVVTKILDQISLCLMSYCYLLILSVMMWLFIIHCLHWLIFYKASR